MAGPYPNDQSNGAAAIPIYFGNGAATATALTLVANTAADLMLADGTRRGARILNWTASPVYFVVGTAGTGTPASGAPSDFIPAADSGTPGQFEFPYAPTGDYRVVGASNGDLTIETW